MTDRDNAPEIVRPARTASPTGRSRWYAGYYLLAGFNIVTIAAGTFLNYQLVRQYEQANQINRYWAEHLSQYAQIETLASAANAPGNDIFLSRSPKRELQRLKTSLSALMGKLAEVRARHNSHPNGMHSNNWSILVLKIEQLSTEMGKRTQNLLDQYAAGDMADAARNMAYSDRFHADILRIVNQLEEEARASQRASLDRQVELASRMRNVEYVIGLLIALLVLGVVANAFRLARQGSRRDVELSAHMAALEASERRFRELSEGSIQGIIVHRNGIPLFANDAWVRIHGYEGAAGANGPGNIAELILPEDRELVSVNERALFDAPDSARQYEYRAIRRDGKVVRLECQERVVRWQGEPALQSTIVDITKRKEAEAGLRDAILRAEQATNARTRFFAAASHDLRQPLHAISLYLPLLLNRMEDRKEREMLTAIQNSCNAMRSLLDSLLDISRLDAGVIEPQVVPTPLLELFDQLGMEFAPQAAATGLEMRVVPADYWVRTDAALLARILRNMLTNAIRYTEQGRILLGARRKGNDIRIEVWDTGIGIDCDKLEHIFEEFYQADNPERDRNRGLGLGLAIIERLANLLGHRVSVRSVRGKGSVFAVTLPLTTEPSTTVTNVLEPDGPWRDLEGRVVLLIDDDPLVMEGTEAMLEDWGCQVVGAASIAEAQRAISENGIVPDVIMADLRLRGNETGLKAVAAVNELLSKAAPAIIVTGDTDPGRIKEVSASGLAILHKPVEPERLQAAILEVLRTAQEEGPAEVAQRVTR